MIRKLNPESSIRQGFTLVELLVVVSIIVLLIGLSLPVVMGMMNGNEMNQGLVTISGAFEESKQYAVSQNTYVWVFLSANPQPGGSIKLARVASTEGRDAFGWATGAVDLSSLANASLYQPVGRPLDLRQVAIKGYSDNYPNVPKLKQLSPSPAVTSMLATVQVTGVRGALTTTFTRAIQFTPTGEARVSGALVRYVDFTVLPLVGNDSNQSVFRVSGLTGKTTLFRNN